MTILHGSKLAQRVRDLSDEVAERLWIAVPYLGSPLTVRRLLGNAWFENPSVSVRLLTDTNDLTGIDTESLQVFHERGEAKSILGLHAKIYVFDNIALVTSANLTNTAFAKRYEVGVLLTGRAARSLITLFQRYWQQASAIDLSSLHKAFKPTKRSTEEASRVKLPELWEMPDDPGGFITNLQKRFLNYDRLLADYNDFAKKYASIQRLWPKAPLFLELDGLLNFLYHEADGTPSRRFAKRKPRHLSRAEQLAEVRKYALLYKKWNDNNDSDDIDWRLDASRTLRRLLSPTRIMELRKSEIEEVLRRLNSLSSYPINRAKILSNNKVGEIRMALNELVNGTGQLASRMNFANAIKFLGSSSMNEIIGFTYPKKYPLINKNANCGLRFFGYHIKAYS